MGYQEQPNRAPVPPRSSAPPPPPPPPPVAGGWPDGHTFIRELLEALGRYSGAMSVTPKEVWDNALADVRFLKDYYDRQNRSGPTIPGQDGPIRTPTPWS